MTPEEDEALRLMGAYVIKPPHTVFVSLMCHPDMNPKVTIESDDVRSVVVNIWPGYAAATRWAIDYARKVGCDLVVGDTDGYHPAETLKRLSDDPPGFHSLRYIVKPYRAHIGFQSRVYGWFWSLVHLTRVRDVSGGLYRLSFPFLDILPPLISNDNRIIIELMNYAALTGTPIFQFKYEEGKNDMVHSHRPKFYQWRLLQALFGHYD